LHFLPLANDITPKVVFKCQVIISNLSDIKGIMLILFTVIILVIIAIFIKNLNDLKVVVRKDINTCLEIGKIGYYSDYLVLKRQIKQNSGNENSSYRRLNYHL